MVIFDSFGEALLLGTEKSFVILLQRFMQFNVFDIFLLVFILYMRVRNREVMPNYLCYPSVRCCAVFRVKFCKVAFAVKNIYSPKMFLLKYTHSGLIETDPKYSVIYPRKTD